VSIERKDITQEVEEGKRAIKQREWSRRLRAVDRADALLEHSLVDKSKGTRFGRTSWETM
jgi:hypothetical protein